MRRVVAVLPLLLLTGCVPLASEDDPLQVRVGELDSRLARIERVAGGPAMLELAQRVDALQTEVRALRGQVEVLENGNEELRRQQRNLYADLERRTAALEARGGQAGPAVAAPGAAAAAAGTAGGSTPEVLYGRAFDALKAADYPVAISGMKEFLAAHPEHELADNAQYWLGEAYYVTRDYESAVAAFTAVGRKWPASPKAADALLKLGYSQFELKRFADARQSLGAVATRYPGTEAARLAQERLRRIP